jgi:integrase
VAGLAGRHLHDMRRSAVRAGIPKHTAMQLSGHRTANIFDRYDVHETRDLEEETARLGSLMPATASTN